MSTLRLPAQFYQQFDADYSREVPGESYGGWQSADIELAPQHTAVVVMHAWDAGTPEKYPGWWRCGEFLARADKIVKSVFPNLLKAVRASKLKLFHVVAGGEHYQQFSGYKRAVELAGAAPTAPEQIPGDPMLQKLQQFRADHGVVGAHNREDVARGFQNLDFPREAQPLGEEGIVENAQQLFALCKTAGINHLIYAGFAINWCLLLSPGGMADMHKHGVMCSALRQAVTAVENKETARQELCKEIALWRVALAFGFVFDVDDFVREISKRH